METYHKPEKNVALIVTENDFQQLHKVLTAFCSATRYAVVTKDGDIAKFVEIEKLFSFSNFRQNPIVGIDILATAENDIGASLRLLNDDTLPGATVSCKVKDHDGKLEAALNAWVEEIRRPKLYSAIAMMRFRVLLPLLLIIGVCLVFLGSGLILLIGSVLGRYPVPKDTTSINTLWIGFVVTTFIVVLTIAGRLIDRFKNVLFPQVVFGIGYGIKRDEQASNYRKYFSLIISFILGIFSTLLASFLAKTMGL